MRLVAPFFGLFVGFLVIQGAWAADNPGPSPEDIAEATDFVQTLADETIARLADEELSDDQQHQYFDDLIERGFAADYMSKVVVGRYWRKMSPDQRAEYLVLFRAFILESLKSRLSLFNDEFLEITGHTTTKKGDIFILSQVVMTSESFAVDWRLRRFDDVYRIIDVRLEGISMVITNQEEVTGIAFSDGIDGLLDSLRERTADTPAPFTSSNSGN